MQCEQTRNGTGCSTVGVCGKTPEVSALQDLLLEKVKAIGFFSDRARQLGVKNPEVDAFQLDALFSTLTNVNFDPARFHVFIKDAEKMAKIALSQYENAAKAAGRPVEIPSWPSLNLPITSDAEYAPPYLAELC